MFTNFNKVSIIGNLFMCKLGVSSFDKTIGLAIKKARLTEGLTLKDLQIKSGITCSFFNKIETSERRVTFEELKKIAELLSTDSNKILYIAKQISEG